MAMDVTYYTATGAAYTAATKDARAFYLVDGTDLYLGSIKLSNASDLATAVANIAQNAADIVTINSTLTKLENTEETTGSIRNIIKGYFDALTAADVPIADADGNFTATNVEGALAELAAASAGGVNSKTVYLTDNSAGQTDYAKVYNLYQGADSSDMTQNTLVGTINIPKDLVVQSGKVVTVSSGTDSDGDSTSVADGTYIKLVIQNQTAPLYINVADLVDDYTGGTTTEATVAVSATNEITVTINEVSGAKLTDGTVTKAKLATAVQASLDLADSAIQSDDLAAVATSGSAADVEYAAAAGSDPAVSVKDAIDDLYDEIGSGGSVAAQIQAAIEGLDTASDVGVASVSNGVVTISGSVKETDGVISKGTATDVTLAKVATTGAAEDVAVTDTAANFSSTTKNVENILAEIAQKLTWQTLS